MPKDAETRGEIVIVIAPPPDHETADTDVDDLLRNALARVSVKDAVGEVALATGTGAARRLSARPRTRQRRPPCRRVTTAGRRCHAHPGFRPAAEAAKRRSQPGTAGRIQPRYFGGESGRRLADRQRLSHSGAAFSLRRRRNRHRRRPPPHGDLRRGESARQFRRGGGVGDSPRQRARIAAAAEIWLANNPKIKFRGSALRRHSDRARQTATAARYQARSRLRAL